MLRYDPIDENFLECFQVLGVNFVSNLLLLLRVKRFFFETRIYVLNNACVLSAIFGDKVGVNQKFVFFPGYCRINRVHGLFFFGNFVWQGNLCKFLLLIV